MILWKSKEIPETRGESYPCSAFRWIFEIALDHFGFVWQTKSKTDNTWSSYHGRAYEVWICKNFKIGFEHFYYDGPHCMFCLGFITFCWNGSPWTGYCKKCGDEA